ncbi:protein translocase subunit SecD [Mailhella massiliensis]|uniref:Protein translocase subunit SecD n=1 Tax=Mailhella massiliensis TaxID=1903261 RepID=A0A921DRL5_9BACT|nr:protein translocase subunit SecD [Mailhella massiliensis]HJD96122.1 protein translocase subunit SecD [Mailhella massiliensis]
MRSLRWRCCVTLLAAFLCLACISVNFFPSLPSRAAWLPSPIHLGLDLRGGIHLTLGADIDQAVSQSLSLLGQDIRSSANDAGIRTRLLRHADGRTLEFVPLKHEGIEQLSNLLRDRFGQMAVGSVISSGSGEKLLVSFRPEWEKQLRERIMDQTVRTLRGRIDAFGVAEPDIRLQGDAQIQIQLPGVTDTARALQLIGRTAQLTFHRVRHDVAPGAALPAGTAWYPLATGTLSRHATAARDFSRGLVLDRSPLLSGQDIVDARPAFDERNQPCVSLQFSARGAEQFERVTGELIYQQFAIVLDGVVQSAPVIQQKISGGKATITGTFTTEEAQDLAVVLRSGSLPAEVSVLEERTVGPSLGADSIRAGLVAGAVGSLGVMLIMQVCYGLSGLLANVMLVFTISLLFAGLGLFGATLTLPGIAGVVLTIGMSVDANVLIFERIREEIGRGLSAANAVEAGFREARSSILDANLTTLITAAVLYQFGTGPVRGFAVTLALGILASMFTAIFVSHLVFELWLRRSRAPKFGLSPHIAGASR